MEGSYFTSKPSDEKMDCQKKAWANANADSESQSKNVGGVNSILATQDNGDLITSPQLAPIEEEPDAQPEDNFGAVEFDLLESSDILGIMTINETVTPYFDFKIPLGSVRSASSSQVKADCCISDESNQFNLVVDSGCTRQMFPYKAMFISYKEAPCYYVVLDDKSKVICLGSGTVSFCLLGRGIILHDVLHIPKLRSPLLLVRSFCRLNGCSFIADNTDRFLTFVLPVVDCRFFLYYHD